jgi:predicted SAM-dependent methyltransferase
VKLHIGGRTPHPAWKIFDVEARPEVDFEILTGFLAYAGFRNPQRVAELGFFDDTSKMELGGVRISLNVIAEK